jgi:DNA replication ATP-dependent helicase Dna2
MLEEDNLELLLVELVKEISNQTIDDKNLIYQYILSLKSLFRRFLENITQNQKQFFPNNYSRIAFITNKYSLELRIKKSLFFLQKIFNNPQIIQKANQSDLQFISILLSELFSAFYDTKVTLILDRGLIEINSTLFKLFNRIIAKQTELVSFRGLIVDQIISNDSSIICFDGNTQIIINCSDFWQELPKSVKNGTKLNCFKLQQLKENLFKTTTESLIVIEPDYLYDISEIAESFTKTGFNAYNYFINKYYPNNFSFYTFIGNVVNYMLDELLVNPRADFEELFLNSLRKKILQFLILNKYNPNVAEEIKENIKQHFDNLNKILPYLTEFDNQIEPSFFSADYGLVGRMDILLQDKGNRNDKTIVELKSGNYPEDQIRFQTSDGSVFYSPMWHSHYAQTIGYNLLADSVYPNRKGTSMILYSKDSQRALREAPNDIKLKRDFIKARNWIYLLENQISNKNYSIFETLEKKLPQINGISAEKFTMLRETLGSLNEVNKKLLFHFCTFILNEVKSAKIGESDANTRYVQRSLWLEATEEKINHQSILNNLLLQLDKSNFNKLYLYFQRTEETPLISSIRKGDPVVIYNDSLFTNRTAAQLLKGVVKTIDSEKIVVSMRNKLTNQIIFDNPNNWTIEPDYIDSSARYLYHSIFKFLTIVPQKIDFLLGRVPPRMEKLSTHLVDTGKYQNIVKKAIEYYPYFIIKGPPGTGKTRIIVKELINFYYRHTNLNILVLAYTNRAVDEIAETLNRNEMQDYYLRLGNKEASELEENMLSYLSENMDIETIGSKIENTRIFLSTVFSALTTPEIFSLKKFNIAIIDEASQILFPHLISILAEVDKFILIGDEKQLPAVVQQPEESRKINDPDLLSLGFNDLGISYFELLINNLQQRKQTDCIALLDEQSRMHPAILEPVNLLFYDNLIKTFKQREPNKIAVEIIQEFLDHIGLSRDSRIIFVDTPTDLNSKINRKHSQLIKLLSSYFASKFKEHLNELLIGIISPFRLQNAEIFRLLDETLRYKITIDTVERFQGSEREIIFLSLPFNSPNQILQTSSLTTTPEGTLIDRKLNVSLTRAKELLVIFGDKDLLKDVPIYRDLIEYFEKREKIVSFAILEKLY